MAILPVFAATRRWLRVLYSGSFASIKGHSPPQFLAHVYCGQTAVGLCIRIPLATEVGLSLGDIVLDGDPAPPPLKGYSPQFSVNVRFGQTAGWTKMPIGMEVGLGPGDVVLDGVTVPP